MLKVFWKRNKGMSFINRLKELKWELKYAWQRVWRGYDDTDVFGFNDSFLEKIILILEDFNKTKISYPADLTFEEWGNILNQMIEYFKNSSEDYTDDKFDDLKEQYDFMQENLNKGMELFTKWFYALWD